MLIEPSHDLKNERYYTYCKRCLHILHDAVTVATLLNGLQLCLHCPDWKVTVCTGHYHYVRAGLHVPYKSELIIT